MKRAGIIVIGNEVLSGKVEDLNSNYLMGELRELGVPVGHVSIIPDDLDLIAAEVRGLSERFDYVFTTGGVGPTHDDMTFEGVGRAFGLGLEESAELIRVIRDFFGEGVSPAYFRMAMIPTGIPAMNPVPQIISAACPGWNSRRPSPSRIHSRS